MLKLRKFSTILILFLLTILVVIITIYLSNDLSGQDSSAADIKQFSPLQSDAVLKNPFVGWAPTATVANNSIHPVKMVYINWSWKEIEPTRGNFNWSGIEQKANLSYWRERDVKLIFQVVLDYPNANVADMEIPQWLYDMMGSEKGTWYDFSGVGKGFSPNYNDPVLISEHQRMINALGARYNNNSDIAFVIAGSIGHWGEWHTWAVPGGFPLNSVSNQYAQHYINAFPNKKLIGRRPTQIFKDNKLGLQNTLIGLQPQSNEWLGWIANGYTDEYGQAQPAMSDFWKYSPSTGEFSPYPGTIYLQASNITALLNILRQSHTSFIYHTDFVNFTGSSIYYDMVLKTIGYRFTVNSTSIKSNVQQGESVQLTVNWENKGVAPFYYNWPVEISISNTAGELMFSQTISQDIRTWMPGTGTFNYQLSIPDRIPDGVYSINIAIIDPSKQKPGVKWALQEMLLDGRYPIAYINVGNTASTSTTNSSYSTISSSSTSSISSTVSSSSTSSTTSSVTSTVTSTTRPISVICGNIDSNGDGVLSGVDMASFISVWRKTCSDTPQSSSCGPKDSNSNKEIDLVDLANFTLRWGEPTCSI